MKTTPFDHIRTARPVNRLAARQTGSGIVWTPNRRDTEGARRWHTPPALQPHPHAKNFVDLTGRRVGRMTVVGYLGKLNPKKKAVWLCRCDCGIFESRSARAIVDADGWGRCQDCLYLEMVKRGRGNSALDSRPPPTPAQIERIGER